MFPIFDFLVEEPEDELFELPKGLSVPKDMELPYTMKIHAIIEKTANFVSQQGGQMEIILKMKQHANPQFAFMHLDNPLHPYYKHLVKEIKSGAYKPAEVKKVSQSEDEDDDGHYLHPSLMAGRPEPVPKFTVPTINFRRSSDDSYSVLVRNLQQHFVEETPPEYTSPADDEHENSATNSTDDTSRLNSTTDTLSINDCYIVPPPPDFQPIVDKMAEYVAKNGDDFEIIVKSRKDKRFDFLQPWHEFYNYYIHKRNTAKMMFSGNAPDHIQEETILVDSTPQSVAIQGSITHQNFHQPELRKEPPENVITKEEFDALYQDSKDEEDSMDFLSSPKDEEDSKEDKKPVKVLKGPISFSLKSRDTDTPTDKTNMTALLLDDSEGESGGEGGSASKEDSHRKKSHDPTHSHNSRTSSVEGEVKAPKQINEFLEAKHAEERIRDKLLATARERLSQQRRERQLREDHERREEQLKRDRQLQYDQQKREKQLQLERKRKAELFLRMLGKRREPTTDSSAVVSHILGSDKPAHIVQGGKNRRPSTHQPIPGIKTDWSSDSASEHSGEEEPISMIGEKLSSDPEEEEPEKGPAPQQNPSNPEGEEKSKKRRRNRYRNRPKKPRKRSKSPPSRYREEKKLPAAYALNKRSRSRSRSPHRYRPTFNHWNRRR